MRRYGLWIVIFLFLIIVRLPGVTRFVTTDEAPWVARSANFYYALGQKEFSYTYQTTPGVTTMWIGAVSFWLQYPEYRGTGWGYFDDYTTFHRFLAQEAPYIDLHKVVVTARFITIVLVAAMFTMGFLILSQFVQEFVLLGAAFWVGMSPFVMGYSRLAHLDGLQSAAMFLSLTAIWAFFQVESQRMRIVYVILSGGAAAIAFLTRLPGILIIPMIGAGALVMRKLNLKDWPYGLLWLGVFVVTFSVVCPAAWQNPLLVWKIFSGPAQQQSQIALSSATELVEGQQSLGYWTRYVKAYLWQETPVTLLGLILAGWAYWRRKGLFQFNHYRRLTAFFFVAAVSYLVIMSTLDKWAIRYALIAFILFGVIAFWGHVSFAQLLPKKELQWGYGAIALIVLLHATISVFPYYINYYNPLMGGDRVANNTMFIGYGEGLDLAAQYLAEKENASNLTVASWYGYGSFSYFFPGETLHIPTGVTWSDGFIRMLQDSDYLVVYTNQWYRNIPPELFALLDAFEPEKRIWFGHIEYARIYRIDDFRGLLPVY